MPRDPRKKKIGVWMTPEEIAALKKLADDNGLHLSAYIQKLARDYAAGRIDRDGRRIGDRGSGETD